MTSEWAAFNAVYLEYFGDPLPTRSAFGASGLALGGLVELECEAYAGEAASRFPAVSLSWPS